MELMGATVTEKTRPVPSLDLTDATEAQLAGCARRISQLLKSPATAANPQVQSALDDFLEAARTRLHEAIAAEKHFTANRPAAGPRFGLATDRQTLDALTSLMASTGTIDWLRENNFAGFSYAIDRLDGLGIYGDRKGAEHEFIDAELEALRKAFQDAAATLLSELGVNAFPTGSGRASIPQEWEIEQPERFNTVVKKVHDGASLVCSTYDDLVRLAKRKLSA